MGTLRDGHYLWVMSHAGRHDTSPDSSLVDGTSVYDLASLTKPLTTALMIHLAIYDGFLSPEEPVQDILPWTEKMFPFGPVNVLHLLAHVSGLPPWAPLFRETSESQKVPELLSRIRASHPPGTQTAYSDLGYVLLGYVLEKTVGRHWTNIYLGLIDGITGPCMGFWPVYPELVVSNRDPSSPPDPGHVHDENARLIGPGAGHAGLFASLGGVTSLVEGLVQSWHGNGPFPRKVMTSMWKHTGRCFTAGWDTPTGKTSTAGELPRKYTVGHLGFTGTSLWIHPPTGTCAVLLTNRVRMGRWHPRIRHIRASVATIAARHFLA